MTTTAFRLEDHKLLDEQTYVASADTDLASSGTLALLLDNPSNSGIDAFIYFGDIYQEDESTVIIYDEVSSVSGGSSGRVENNYIGSSNTSSLTVTQDPSYSGDNTHQKATFVGSGSHGIFDGYKVLLPPGEKILIEITNDGSGNSETSIRVSWAEKPK